MPAILIPNANGFQKDHAQDIVEGIHAFHRNELRKENARRRTMRILAGVVFLAVVVVLLIVL